MKNWLKLLVVVVAMVAVVAVVGWRVWNPWDARKMIYGGDSVQTEYPGEGEILVSTKRQFLVSPLGVGKPYYVKGLEEDKLPQDRENYEIIEIPEQVNLDYAVGRFVRWEDISGSSDKYLVLGYSQAEHEGIENIELKYRVGFERSLEYSFQNEIEDNTNLAVERVAKSQGQDTSLVNELEYLDQEQGDLEQMGFERVKQLFRKNDAVIVKSVYNLPVINKRDENGYLYALLLIVRREGGAEELMREIEKTR